MYLSIFVESPLDLRGYWYIVFIALMLVIGYCLLSMPSLEQATLIRSAGYLCSIPLPVLHGLSLRWFLLHWKVVTLFRLKSRDWIHQRVIDRIFFLFFTKIWNVFETVIHKIGRKKTEPFLWFHFRRRRRRWRRCWCRRRQLHRRWCRRRHSPTLNEFIHF